MIHGYMLRHKVKPGITGLAQVNGCRGETDTLIKMEQRIQYDHRYIREWSLWMDLKISSDVLRGLVHEERVSHRLPSPARGRGAGVRAVESVTRLPTPLTPNPSPASRERGPRKQP